MKEALFAVQEKVVHIQTGLEGVIDYSIDLDTVSGEYRYNVLFSNDIAGEEVLESLLISKPSPKFKEKEKVKINNTYKEGVVEFLKFEPSEKCYVYDVVPTFFHFSTRYREDQLSPISEEKPKPLFELGERVRYPNKNAEGVVYSREFNDHCSIYEYLVLLDNEHTMVSVFESQLFKMPLFELGEIVYYENGKMFGTIKERRYDFDLRVYKYMAKLLELELPQLILEHNLLKLTNHTVPKFPTGENVTIRLTGTKDKVKSILASSKGYEYELVDSHEHFYEDELMAVSKPKSADTIIVSDKPKFMPRESLTFWHKGPSLLKEVTIKKESVMPTKFEYLFVQHKQTKNGFVFFTRCSNYEEQTTDAFGNTLEILNYYGSFGWEYVGWDNDRLLFKRRIEGV